MNKRLKAVFLLSKSKMCTWEGKEGPISNVSFNLIPKEKRYEG